MKGSRASTSTESSSSRRKFSAVYGLCSAAYRTAASRSATAGSVEIIRSPSRRIPLDLLVGQNAAVLGGDLTTADGGEDGHFLADLLECGRLGHPTQSLQGDLLLGERLGFDGHRLTRWIRWNLFEHSPQRNSSEAALQASMRRAPPPHEWIRGRVGVPGNAQGWWARSSRRRSSLDSTDLRRESRLRRMVSGSSGDACGSGSEGWGLRKTRRRSLGSSG